MWFHGPAGRRGGDATLCSESYELLRQLQQAMELRAVIEQAKGILMGAQRCTPDADGCDTDEVSLRNAVTSNFVVVKMLRYSNPADLRERLTAITSAE
jgi:hypothetical protein